MVKKMSDIRDQFDSMIEATGRFSRLVQLRYDRNHLGDILNKRCGSCEHWMKTSDCPLEARGDKPSSDHWACNQFQMKQSTQDLYEKRLAENNSGFEQLGIKP